MTVRTKAEGIPDPAEAMVRRDVLAELSDLDARVLAERAESLAQEGVEEPPDEITSVMLFRLGEEWYAVRVEQVREIFSGYVITPVPCTADQILGVMSIRGDIISVTDIRRLLHLPGTGLDMEVPVIVVYDGKCASALTVDEIGDILEVAQDDIQPPLAVLEKSQAEYITGSIYTNGTLVALVNLDRVLAPVGGTG